MLTSIVVWRILMIISRKNTGQERCIVSFLTRCCFYFATFYLEKSRHENRQYYAFTRRFVDVSNAGAPIFDSRPNLKKKCVTPRGLFSIQIDRRPGNLSVILNTLD